MSIGLAMVQYVIGYEISGLPTTDFLVPLKDSWERVG